MGARARFALTVSAAVAVACVCTCGCASGIVHSVRPGENLYRIGKAYGIDYHDLARYNRIHAPYEIKAGETLFIPGASRRLPVTIITPRATSTARPEPRTIAAAGASGFAWPVSGRVTSAFGKRSHGYHDGIDIAAERGTAVHAAAHGKVIFSDQLSGYGNVVIVEHRGGFTTVYAHNDRNLVRKGAWVRAGQELATVGSTGRASSPHLHFEIRKSNVARNPLYYLPRT